LETVEMKRRSVFIVSVENMPTRGTEEIKRNDKLMRVTTGLQHTPAVVTMGPARNDHVELDFVTMELDSREDFGQEVHKIVCSWHIDNADLS